MGFMKQLNVRSVAHIAAPTPEDVRIRPYGVTDHDRLVRMSDRLSGSSLYTRFFSGTPRIPDYYVAAMDRLDHWDRDALVALVGGEMVGIAEYVRDVRDPSRAEIAVLVAMKPSPEDLAAWEAAGATEVIWGLPDKSAEEVEAFIGRHGARLGLS